MTPSSSSRVAASALLDLLQYVNRSPRPSTMKYLRRQRLEEEGERRKARCDAGEKLTKRMSREKRADGRRCRGRMGEWEGDPGVLVLSRPWIERSAVRCRRVCDSDLSPAIPSTHSEGSRSETLCPSTEDVESVRVEERRRSCRNRKGRVGE